MTQTQKNVMLVPVDFSEISLNALEHAAQTAKHFDNDLVILSIVEENLLTSLFSNNEEKEAQAREKTLPELEKLADQIKAKYGVSCKTEVRVGRIYKTIVETAVEFGCDCIIMGTHGASGFTRIVGSNAGKVINYSTIPVIVVKSNKQTNAYKNIVFPLDLSVESKQKVKMAIHLGKSYKSTIHILYNKVSDEFLNNKMIANLHQVENIFIENGIEFTIKEVDESSSDFADETLKFAEYSQADLIMIMTQSEDKAITEYLIDTYAQRIVNAEGTVPVMCVNPNRDVFKAEFVI
ncbi:MAG: universal stress protein [Candidatus Methylacidiphilales bacterium]|nr:universal stress protein [Bacteroidia bacterium]